jgi:cytoskeletal protein CcmA (bactofilin family)
LASVAGYQFIQELATQGTSTYAGESVLPLTQMIASDITLSPAADPALPYVSVIATAENSRSKREVVRTITLLPEALAFNYALYTHGDLRLSGSAVVDGDVYSNATISAEGASAIDGDTFSVGTTTTAGSGDITGIVAEAVSSIPPPQVDTEPYRQLASSQETVFSTANTARAYLNNRNQTATVVVEGGEELRLSSNNTALVGTLVTDGDLELTGGTFTAPPGALAVIVRGNLRMSGGVTINGIAYVSGTTTIGAGNNRINGSLISVGGLTLTSIAGNSRINFDPTIADTWQQLLGLVTTSAALPRMIRWDER